MCTRATFFIDEVLLLIKASAAFNKFNFCVCVCVFLVPAIYLLDFEYLVQFILDKILLFVCFLLSSIKYILMYVYLHG